MKCVPASGSGHDDMRQVVPKATSGINSPVQVQVHSLVCGDPVGSALLEKTILPY